MVVFYFNCGVKHISWEAYTARHTAGGYRNTHGLRRHEIRQIGKVTYRVASRTKFMAIAGKIKMTNYRFGQRISLLHIEQSATEVVIEGPLGNGRPVKRQQEPAGGAVYLQPGPAPIPTRRVDSGLVVQQDSANTHATAIGEAGGAEPHVGVQAGSSMGT